MVGRYTPNLFLSRLCGGEYIVSRNVETAAFLSRLCGGECRA